MNSAMPLAVEMFTGLMGYGYAGIIMYMVLTGCGFPMPEEVAIIAGARWRPMGNCIGG